MMRTYLVGVVAVLAAACSGSKSSKMQADAPAPAPPPRPPEVDAATETDLAGGILGKEAHEGPGGLGSDPPDTTEPGFGPGGAGAPRSSAVPQVRLGQPTCTGDLDIAIVRRYIKRNISKITYCYEKELLANAALEGTVASQFAIGPNGTVVSSEATGVNAEAAKCIAAVIKAIEFPKPKTGGAVQCNYPFTFRPTGG